MIAFNRGKDQVKSSENQGFLDPLFFRFNYSFKVKWIIFLCSGVSLFIAFSLVFVQAQLSDRLTHQRIALAKVELWNIFYYKSLLQLWKLHASDPDFVQSNSSKIEKRELQQILEELISHPSLAEVEGIMPRALQNHMALLKVHLETLDISNTGSQQAYLTRLNYVQQLIRQEYQLVPHIDEETYLFSLLVSQASPNTQYGLIQRLLNGSGTLNEKFRPDPLYQAYEMWMRITGLMQEGGVISSLSVAEALKKYLNKLQEFMKQSNASDLTVIGPLFVDTWEMTEQLQSELKRMITQQQYRLHLRNWVGVGVILLSILVVLTVYLTRVMRRPLEDLRLAAEALANGNLNVRVPIVTQDEVASIGKAFNQMAKFCQEVIHEVAMALDTLSQPSKEMIALAKASEQNVLSQQHSIQCISSHTERIWERGEELQIALDQVRKIAIETGGLATQGRQNLIEMENVLNVIGMDAKRLVQALILLQQKTLTIQDVIGAILTIADQANLLAINTALRTENHRLHQSGFGVIAKKIAELAHLVGSNALKVEKELREIVTTLSATLQVVKSFSEDLQELVFKARLSREALKTHIEGWQQQLILFEQVSQNMHTQAEEAYRIHETIQHLSEVANMTTESVRGFSKRITSLYEDTSNLRALIQRFHSNSNL